MSRIAYGYSPQHWKGCMCEVCGTTFQKHNPSAPNVIQCPCAGCQSRHNEQLNSAARSNEADVFGMEKISMAGIHVCEREECQSMMKGRAVGGLTLALSSDDSIQPSDRIIRMEICPGCVEDIYTVLMHGPIGERQRAYSKPFRPESVQTEDALSGVTNEQLAAALFQRMMSDPNARTAIMARTSDADDNPTQVGDR